jgi:hypothetical protein
VVTDLPGGTGHQNNRSRRITFLVRRIHVLAFLSSVVSTP